MTQTLAVEMDSALYKDFDLLCANMGISKDTAIRLFARKAIRQQKLPFEITADDDPFYSESNIAYLTKLYEDIKNGKVKTEYHDLIEVEE
ncbi:MAG: type II toxin-antitoxin system RelB/DinJ family antitoxin [Oscillospiraceae bacterium]|nr:type II toxin-antitoxin system RelB/DinJ family antitoxin [Oscillospiraceae bacterium]